MDEEQEKRIMSVLANNANNRLTIELMNGIMKAIKKILEKNNGC